MPAIARPIETAPRDGTHVVALCRRAGWREMWFKRDQYEGDYWMDEQDSEPEPTHWIDMPVTMEEIPPVSQGTYPSCRHGCQAWALAQHTAALEDALKRAKDKIAAYRNQPIGPPQ